jgi:hypothetical protein
VGRESRNKFGVRRTELTVHIENNLHIVRTKFSEFKQQPNGVLLASANFTRNEPKQIYSDAPHCPIIHDNASL